MSEKDKEIFLRIYAFLVRFTLSYYAYANLNSSLLAKVAANYVKSILIAEGVTEKEITHFWLKHEKPF